MRSSFFEGRPPKSVNMYWRRFRISDIPIDNEAAFAMWLKNRWTEKDYLLEHFARHGTYPEGDPVKAMKTEAALQKLANGSGEGQKIIKPVVKTAKFITTEVKAGGWEEFMSIFTPITAAATALSTGELAPDSIDFDALLNKVAQQQQLNLLKTGAAPKATRSHEEMRRALTQASKSTAAGQAIKGSTIETITRNAAQQQKEMLEAMSKTGLPQTKSPTEGRNLDPAVRNTIESVHEEARKRLLRASKPPSQATKSPPDVRKSMGQMAPMETMITRPLSTMAMQQAAKHVQRAAGAAAGKKAAPSPVTKKATDPAKKQATSKPASVSKVNPQSSGKPAGKVAAVPKQLPNGSAAKAKK